VDIFFKNKRLFTKSDEATLREVWNILKQCILIDKDVLLPRMVSTKWKEMFFIIAFADQRGTEVLKQRIDEQIGRYEEIQKTDLETAVSYTMFDVSSRKGDHPWDDLVKDITLTIGDWIEHASREEDPK